MQSESKEIIDTSIEGFAKIGIKITEEQFKDLCAINTQSFQEAKTLPVWTIVLVLKTFGLIPTEYPDESVYSKDDKDEYRKKFGCLYKR